MCVKQICVFHESSTWSQLTFGDFFLKIWYLFTCLEKGTKNIVVYELYISNLVGENYILNKIPDNQKMFSTLSWLAILSF